MKQTWQNAYEGLKKFIAAHPAVEIGLDCIIISGDIRPEFYRLFDAVRVSFVKERFTAELDRAYALSTAYAEASRAVKEEMRLEDIEINAALNWFLLDPVDGLTRVLFDPLFDLLKGKTDLAAFTKVADSAVADSFKVFFRYGYQHWGELSLLRLLQPDHLWLGKTHDFCTDPIMQGDTVEGNHDDFVPDPVESKKLVFDALLRASFVVPRALVHSARLNAYVSLRPGWYLPRWRARTLNERLEWLELKKIYAEFGAGNLWPGMMLYATDEPVEDLKLVADFYNIARPEISIEFMEEADWWNAKNISDIARHHEILTPRQGTYVISRVEVPPEAFKSLETMPEGIHVLSVGYDPGRLEPVADALAEATAAIKESRLKELEAVKKPG